MDKTHILQEIKRTAKVNGGEPLGLSLFEQETGIKAADWFGKFWARWGDAVKEAGFTPNELQAAFDESDVLNKFAELASELGRIPVKGDLRLKKLQDESFPNEKVFYRFGSKIDLVKRLASFCREQDKHKDVQLFCENYLAVNEIDLNEPKNYETEIGFVYLIKSGRFYKIGRSNSAGRREYELAIQLPEKVKTVHVIQTDDPSGIESYWHNRFIAKRKNGEWFELSSDDVSIFRRRKFM